MSGCPDQQAMLHALLDDELDAANTAACEAHLRSCAECAAELERLRSLRAILRDAAPRFAAPAHLRDRVESALPRGSTTSWTTRLGWGAGGAALAMAASLLLTLSLPTRPEPSALEAQLVSSHIRSLLANHLTDVATSDQHQVKPWFNGRIDYAPPVPELAAQGFPLAGGRLDYVAGRVVPAIVYRRRLHVINLFVLRSGAPAAAVPAQSEGGYHMRHWQAGGFDFYAISDVGEADLEAFEQAFTAAAR